MKKELSFILLVFIFLLGLSLMLYPTLADLWNRKTQSQAISAYEQTLQEMDGNAYAPLFEQADAYNEALRALPEPLLMYDQVPGYYDLLDLSGSGVMGYVTIERIGVELPIYHGTSDEVLSSAAGHLEGTSLPVGGAGTHALLSAHRGLPSAMLFTDLGKLEPGDTFTITVFDRVLTYEVDQILIVKPHEVEELAIREGADLCTLLTCTPYGINSHRLLVRGRRIETAAQKPRIYVSNDAYRIDPLIVTPVVSAPMLFVLLIVLLVKYRPRRNRPQTPPQDAGARGERDE